MQALSMGRNAYAQTLDHKETVRLRSVTIVAQVTATSECVEGLDT